MKTIIYTNNFNNKGKITELILGIVMILVALSGLFMGSTLLLKLIMYILPVILLLYSIKPYKMAFYFFKKNIKRFLIFIIQAIILTISAIYILFYPVESLNYIIIIIGVLSLINSINNMILTNSKYFSFLPFLFGTICILFSNQIISIFYTLLLLFILFIGVSKTTSYIHKNKNRT